MELSSFRSAPILIGLTTTDLRALAGIAQERTCERGERLLKRGEVASHLYIVKDGRFALTVLFDVGGKRVKAMVEKKEANDALGWSATLSPREALYSVYCVRPGSVVQFARDDLRELMTADMDLGFRLMRNITQLVGRRLSVLQGLWLKEVERAPDRVRHWMEQQLEL